LTGLPGTVLIIGCGFLGEAAADLFFGRGVSVIATCISGKSAARLNTPERPAFAVDVSSLSAVAALRGRIGPVDAVVHCASSGRGGPESYRAVYLKGMRNLVAAFPEARFLFTGSTSVYGQTDGSTVTEESPASPDREIGRILLDAERAALDAGGWVARLGGIYGPGRSAPLKKMLAGTAILESGGGRWINQIHRDDAAAAIVHLILGGHPPGIYNVTDDSPATQRTVYGWIADFLGRPLPPEGPVDLSRKRGWTDKRVSNAKLRATGWSPIFTSYRDALPAIAPTIPTE